MPASIYGLYDETGSLRYIGKANDPEKRLKSHLRDATRRNTPLYCWIRKHGMPRMAVLEADCEDWAESERRHIAEALARGDQLFNLAEGGNEPYCAPLTRQSNGTKVALAIHSCPESKRLWHAKRQLSLLIKDGALNQHTKNKMKARPDIFGQWLHLI